MANKLDAPARLEFANGNWCTDVPLQFISESLGYIVLWDSENRLVKINYEPVIGTNELSLDRNKVPGETNMKITMKAEPTTYPLSTDKIYITITNNTPIYCFTGMDYSVEHYNGSTWCNLPLSICAAMTKVDLLSGESKGFDIYLLKNQYDYQPGKYRVRKTISTGEQEYELIAEFELK